MIWFREDGIVFRVRGKMYRWVPKVWQVVLISVAIATFIVWSQNMQCEMRWR